MIAEARPVKRRRFLRASRSIAILTAGALAAGGAPVRAQDVAKGLPMIRDSEIEQLLREYTQPKSVWVNVDAPSAPFYQR